ncbi:CACTA en-spm transposon protein [Cucumis melo var. makuwa]|uniref:CACTA en-spm transposon protein n=1 Tax=Cucumis melo var. makuwa TaxID=1194695 RepID=A0A5A7VGZ8_CUCMM|nr:CACTA en-spm transposon protein [Cucumis melo var. makuwa]TYK07184.1 CACTA en-spm transposon protein [Cucumis melo var. makuwa]
MHSKNWKIPMSIVLEGDKPISPHAVRFSCTIGVLMRNTFQSMPSSGLMHLQSTSMSSRVTYSMWKEFKADNHRHSKQFNNPEEARGNLPPRLMNSVKD